jgi:outer membrane receptor protein involved in Fe transport
MPVMPGALANRFFLAGNLQVHFGAEFVDRRPLGGAVLADVTATVRIDSRFDLQAGVRNAFDRRYEDPIYLTTDRLRGDGRSIFLKLVCRVLE